MKRQKPTRRSLLIAVQVAILAPVLWLTVASAGDETYQRLELFTDVLAIVEKSYVEPVDLTELIYGGIRGMLATLDPHSSFLSPEMYQDMKADTHGEFGGVGIEIAVRDGQLLVVAPIEGTPADEAGIEAGDLIRAIDGVLIKDAELMPAVRQLRGAKGDAVTLTIWRDGFDQPRDYTLVRDIIHINSIKGRLLEPGYGYVKITQFQEKTGADLEKELDRLHTFDSPLKGLILDLRNNPGGLLDQAVAVADQFLSEGLIVYTEGREEGSQMRFSATSSGTEPDYPLVVLINGGSASASEIVAGALRDHGRALILGEKSFGKGSVQTIIPLSDDSGLRLTTARYFTPSGVSIQARGIEPDIVVSGLRLESKGDTAHFREGDLKNHIDQPDAASQSTETTGPHLSDTDQTDFQLMRAFDLLKGLELLRGMTS